MARLVVTLRHLRPRFALIRRRRRPLPNIHWLRWMRLSIAWHGATPRPISEHKAGSLRTHRTSHRLYLRTRHTSHRRRVDWSPRISAFAIRSRPIPSSKHLSLTHDPQRLLRQSRHFQVKQMVAAMATAGAGTMIWATGHGQQRTAATTTLLSKTVLVQTRAEEAWRTY